MVKKYKKDEVLEYLKNTLPILEKCYTQNDITEQVEAIINHYESLLNDNNFLKKYHDLSLIMAKYVSLIKGKMIEKKYIKTVVINDISFNLYGDSSLKKYLFDLLKIISSLPIELQNILKEVSFNLVLGASSDNCSFKMSFNKSGPFNASGTYGNREITFYINEKSNIERTFFHELGHFFDLENIIDISDYYIKKRNIDQRKEVKNINILKEYFANDFKRFWLDKTFKDNSPNCYNFINNCYHLVLAHKTNNISHYYYIDKEFLEYYLKNIIVNHNKQEINYIFNNKDIYQIIKKKINLELFFDNIFENNFINNLDISYPINLYVSFSKSLIMKILNYKIDDLSIKEKNNICLIKAIILNNQSREDFCIWIMSHLQVNRLETILILLNLPTNDFINTFNNLILDDKMIILYELGTNYYLYNEKYLDLVISNIDISIILKLLNEKKFRNDNVYKALLKLDDNKLEIIIDNYPMIIDSLNNLLNKNNHK